MQRQQGERAASPETTGDQRVLQSAPQPLGHDQKWCMRSSADTPQMQGLALCRRAAVGKAIQGEAPVHSFVPVGPGQPPQLWQQYKRGPAESRLRGPAQSPDAGAFGGGPRLAPLPSSPVPILAKELLRRAVRVLGVTPPDELAV